MNRKRILLVGAGVEQTIAIREAKQLGYWVGACDSNPKAPGLVEADKCFVVDIRDKNQLISIGKEYKIDGIFCHAVEIPDIISSVSQELNIPGINPEVAITATNKIKRILQLTKCGIPCAKFTTVDCYEDLHKKALFIGFPLILKPIDCAGSRGVRMVYNKADLEQSYREALTFGRSKEVLLEEVLEGPQISTESVVFNGEIKTFAFADRNYSNSYFFNPYFIEDGINFPSNLSVSLQNSVYELVNNTIKALGINFGAAKGDIIIDHGIPKIIEMAARTSGGWFGAGSIPIATGINMLKPLLQMAVNEPPDLNMLNATRNLGCAQRYIIPTQSGILRDITGADEAINSPGVVMHDFFLPQIGSVIKKATNHAERYGHIICTASTRDEAILRCEKAISKIKLIIR